MKRWPRIMPVLFVMTGVFVGMPEQTHAVPGFARDTEITCSSCHTVWPQLNDKGREFKTSGFNDLALLDLGTEASLDKMVPISGRLNFRLVDKRTSRLSQNEELTDKDTQLKLRVLHEVELFAAGRAGKRLSYFVELEAEDEWPDPNGDAPGFQVQMATGAARVLLSDNVSLYGGYASPFYADVYNTLNYRKTNRREWSAVSQGFVPGEGQVVGMAARSGKMSGLLAWGGNPGDLEGHDPEDLSARVAVDVAPGIMIGGWGNVSNRYDSASGKSSGRTNRFGGDAQVDRGAFSLNTVIGVLNDKVSDVSETNVSVEALLIQTVQSPILSAVIPHIGIDWYTISDGEESFVDLGAFLTFLHKDNFRSQIGWEGNLSAPDVFQHKESRITLAVDVGF